MCDPDWCNGGSAVFPGRKQLNFQPGLGMEGPSLSETHLQPGRGAGGAHELVQGSLLREDTAEDGTARPCGWAGFAPMEREVPASLFHLQY